MIFGDVPIQDVEGAILAHSRRVGKTTFKKGRVLSAEDVAALQEVGIASVVAARLEPGDIGEDAAADRVAKAAAGANVSASAAFTGRVNLFAQAHGVAVVDRQRLDAVNLIDESVTVATVEPYAQVEPKQMVATIKIIPFAAPEAVVERCAELAAQDGGLVRIVPFAAHRVGLIQTMLDQTKESVLDKGSAVLSARVEALGSRIVGERRCPHEAGAVAQAIRELRAEGCDLLLIAGASAITDRRDVIPAGIVAAGGAVDHFGMPVDPGNLLLVGRHEEVPVMGLPGCARSPKFNGFDWVLQRLAARLPVGPREVMGMGAGGLLTEIPSRPLPRAEATAQPVQAPRAPRIAALILAAGQSRRMGTQNKLLAELEGKAMVARVADAVLQSSAAPIIAVVGHEADKVRAALAGRDIAIVENPRYAEGISTSIHRGLAAVPEDSDGVLVCLGDMPRVSAAEIDRLIAAFNPVEGRALCVPTYRGKRGNPVLIARRFFAEIQEIAGDVGARHLMGAYPELTCEVEMAGDGVLLDIDTPQALEKIRA